MSITTINSTDPSFVRYYDGEYTVVPSFGSLRLVRLEPNQGIPDIQYRVDGVDLITNQKKVLISLNIGMYNFFYTCVTSILKVNKEHPGCLFVLDAFGLYSDIKEPYFKFLLKLLNDLNIDYIILPNDEIKEIYINDFYVIDQALFSEQDIDLFYKTFLKYIKNPDVQPFRTVYISRGYVPDRTYLEAKPGLRFSSDNRILDEPVLEKFFLENNVEVTHPEDFKDFVDQINYFYETKTLISLTSSGISNSLFMKPNGTVFEIVTPLIQGIGINGHGPIHTKEDLHHIYNALVYVKDHYYVSIPNQDRESKTIIEKIKGNPSTLAAIGISNE
jgi:hypothetical protein